MYCTTSHSFLCVMSKLFGSATSNWFLLCQYIRTSFFLYVLVMSDFKNLIKERLLESNREGKTSLN